MMSGMGSGDGRTSRAYRSSRREEQARATRRRVLEAAASLFRTRGYAATTIRAIAAEAGVAVPTVELLFGAKARLLKAAIDVAIAGDDADAPVLQRSWTEAASAAANAEEFLTIVAGVIGPAQSRSAGLVLAVFEGSATDVELAELSEQMIRQRAVTAGWLVDMLATKAALREDLSRQDAVDAVWILMDPALFDRLVRHRHWSVVRYQAWFMVSARRLLVPDTPDSDTPETDPRRIT